MMVERTDETNTFNGSQIYQPAYLQRIQCYSYYEQTRRNQTYRYPIIFLRGNVCSSLRVGWQALNGRWKKEAGWGMMWKAVSGRFGGSWAPQAAGMALNSFKPGAKQGMHGGQELQKGSSSYHRQAGSVKSCDHDWLRGLASLAQCSEREDGETRDRP
jgi:hypothetical protein